MDLLLGARRCFAAVAFVAPLTVGSTANAQVYEVLSSFRGADGADGITPHTAMIVGPDGSLYGTTPHDDRAPAIIYRVDLEGVRTTVYSFQNDFGSSYCSPSGRLAVGLDGALYGLAAGCGWDEGGILFRLAGASFTVLNGFDSIPSTGLARGLDGKLYGATNPPSPGRDGGIFTWDGALSIIHRLVWTPASPAPNFSPDFREFIFGELTLGPDGSLYMIGGNEVRTPLFLASSAAAVMRITPAGAVEDVYYLGGVRPAPGVLPTVDGSLCGSVVEPSVSELPWVPGPAWMYCKGTVTELPSFGANATLAEGLNGSIYGTTLNGGLTGTIFQRREGGSMTTLHSFDEFGGAGEWRPTGGLTRGSDGHLYGTTYAGGDSSFGVVFRLRMPAEADASANGRQGPLTLGTLDPLQVSFAFHAGLTNVQDQAELYVAVVTPSGTTYWMKPDQSFALAPTRLYSGALPSFPPVPLIDLPLAGVLPAGDYYWVMIVDADTNGVPNGTYVDFVKTTRR